MGYYWLTMGKDCMDYLKKCQACQFHANFIHQLPEPLHPTITSWSFDVWGLDVVGPIAPKFSDSHSYILATTYYFSKWAKAIPLKELKKQNVVSFIKVNIIHRYGEPRYIIVDNGKPFSNRLMDKLCEDFGFKQRDSSMYNARPTKVVGRTKKDWQERINEALLSHPGIGFAELMSNFPIGHPSWDCSSPNSLNFGVHMTPKLANSQKALC
ncbi:unnamed protein product [Prunus armeniaca]